MTREQLTKKQREQWEAFHKEKAQAEEKYQRLYDKYYKTGNEITNDQRAEVRKSFSGVEKEYGKDKLNEMLRDHIREREEYNAEAYTKWTALEEKRDELIKQYGKIDNIPKEQWDKYQEQKRLYDKEWGEKGEQLSSIQAGQSKDHYEHEKAVQAYHEKHLSPYEKTIRQHMKERVEFNGKVADQWRQHEQYRETLAKEYNGWQLVPAYQKELFKQRKEAFEKEWGDDGTQKQNMRQRHQKEIAVQIRLETEKQTQKDRDKDKE